MELNLLCGIPGSGKSTLVENLKGYTVSTDSLRKYLWGNEAIVEHDKVVFNISRELIDYLLSRGINVIFDATNLRRSRRAEFIQLAQKYGATIILHWVNCPLEQALFRNSARERKVPEQIIRALHKSFQRPKTEEGIDILNIYDQELNLTEVNYREIPYHSG